MIRRAEYVVAFKVVVEIDDGVEGGASVDEVNDIGAAQESALIEGVEAVVQEEIDSQSGGGTRCGVRWIELQRVDADFEGVISDG